MLAAPCRRCCSPIAKPCGLALASGGLPPELTRSAARAGSDAQGRLWLQPEADLSREAAAVLARLGVAILGGGADVLLAPISGWWQLLPLAPTAFPPDPAGPALFEVPAQQLAQFVAEIQRLTPAAQIGFRLADLADESARILLRVERPPYLTLLRARQEANLAAYVEQAAGVWVEAGFSHPLAEQIVPPAGQVVFIRNPSHWTWKPEHECTREVRTFPLPPARLTDESGPAPSIDLPLRLEDSRCDESAELWVIHERPLEQLAELAAEAGAALLSRFRAAVVAPQGARSSCSGPTGRNGRRPRCC